MITLSKICDAADWFDTEFAWIIKNELREPARFHRKQWEFAQIFLTLRKLGFLSPDKNGLSLGGGNERVLYSIANHIKKLIVTDLYENNTTWDCARTNDPNEFIRNSKPFEIDESKIDALHMDMRYLDFKDNSFDFCYSSCAVEHIGHYSDFLQHLNEVYRVLKPDGIYVFTTELQFGDMTIKDPNNYVFSKNYLTELLSNTEFTPEFNVDSNLNEHIANNPLPSGIRNLNYKGSNTIGDYLFDNLPHIILLRGNVPFTSVLFVLRKSSTKTSANINFIGFEKTKNLLLKSVNDYQKMLADKELSISPFSLLPNGVSRYFLDHANFFSSSSDQNSDDKTLFHSDYLWLGKGKREISISFKAADLLPHKANSIQLRIHKYNTYNSSEIICEFEKNIHLTKEMIVSENLTLQIDEEFNYAFLAHIVEGQCTFSDISIRIKSVSPGNSNSQQHVELKEEILL